MWQVQLKQTVDNSASEIGIICRFRPRKLSFQSRGNRKNVFCLRLDTIIKVSPEQFARGARRVEM